MGIGGVPHRVIIGIFTFPPWRRPRQCLGKVLWTNGQAKRPGRNLLFEMRSARNPGSITELSTNAEHPKAATRRDH